MTDLSSTREGDVALLEIQREPRRNALDAALWTDLKAAAEELAANPPRVVLLTGRGGHFCSGMDLNPDNPLITRLVTAVGAQDSAALRALIEELKGSLAALASIPCPVVAAIEGTCLGGGLELALACDLRVAARDAVFALPEAQLGMVPDVGGTARSLALLGPARAAELILTGRRLSGEEACAWGLVNRVTEPGEALAGAHALAQQLLTSSPSAAREALSVLRAAAPTAAVLELETAAGARALSSGECLEGAAAFAAKRPPSWFPT